MDLLIFNETVQKAQRAFAQEYKTWTLIKPTFPGDVARVSRPSMERAQSIYTEFPDEVTAQKWISAKCWCAALQAVGVEV